MEERSLDSRCSLGTTTLIGSSVSNRRSVD
jgi:hypothetical protein